MNSSYYNYLKGQKKSERTINLYTTYVDEMLVDIDKPEQFITSLDLVDWQSHISHLASSTVNLKISAVKNYFKFLKTYGLIDSNPSENMHGPKVQNKVKQYMTADMVKAMADNARTARDRAIILLFGSTGLRVSELTDLTLEAYQDMKFKGLDYLVIVGKGNKERRVNFNAQVQEAIDAYLSVRPKSNCDRLFLSFGRGGVIDHKNLGETLKTTARRAGIPFWNEVSPHWLRAACATIMADKGFSIPTIGETLGHSKASDYKTTLRYIKTNDQQVHDAAMMMTF